MIEVILTEDEIAEVYSVAKQRTEVNKAAKNRTKKGLVGKVYARERADVVGLLGEKAASKGLGINSEAQIWTDEERKRLRDIVHDVGPFNVRTTEHLKGSLIFFNKDRNDVPFVLVIMHSENTFQLVGWAWAEEGKLGKYWRDVGYGHPCYYMPQRKLRPMEDAKDIIENWLASKTSTEHTNEDAAVQTTEA